MNAVLIPVKTFAESKQRLAPYYSPAERADLAAALCEDFFAVVSHVQGVDAIFIVTAEPTALEMARGYDFQTIAESEQTSESHSVDFASRFCTAQGVRALLRLPIDIPLAMTADIEAIVEQIHESSSCIIVPSRDGRGTNALLRAPPTLFPSHFGPDSFALHLQEAERCGASVKILRNPRLELDIDEMADLVALNGQIRAGGATAQWLAHHGPPTPVQRC